MTSLYPPMSFCQKLKCEYKNPLTSMPRHYVTFVVWLSPCSLVIPTGTALGNLWNCILTVGTVIP